MATKNKKKRWLPPKIPVIDFKKYRGKQLAVLNGKIVASGKDTIEVLKKAKARYPNKKIWEFLLISVPMERYFIY
ncbi:MAG: hypothetical protein COX89_01015 [Candidatus Nealsonbacteria bacterium CG_4_10_14_0_2_um_filter_37_10]|uniref:DUF5678 domain-containing protein n=2 Tax=Candidatus Nealsoniibacteriota TaxID=1817911 RepID=A0A2M7V031_9BACT|nr:MAG: hypothetical protein COX89_01015 [Candidatus Nealsonbacteria bacterium CG_4_10_14_0_2_um_filter_37_10]PJA83955.1 MAG: hypothetical protein CO145_03140 [Candidatus Nealsonbacteria bacterium CG_4_9_14_3_um_filter_37_13]